MKTILVFSLCLLYAGLNVLGAGIIKNELLVLQTNGNALSSPLDYLSFVFRLKVILGFITIFIAALVMFKALSLQNFSIIGPVATGFNFLLTVFVGILFFNDKISFGQYIGLFLIITGIVVLSLSLKNA